jgi:hypothetical protein
MNSLIAALRGASAAPAGANAGITMLDPTTGASEVSVPAQPVIGALRRAPSGLLNTVPATTKPTSPQQFFSAQQPASSSGATMLDPFAAGAALNDKYRDLFQQDTGIDLPDMRQFGDRYEWELATPGGRRNLGRDIGYARAEVRPEGIYKAGDFGMLPGLDFDDPWTKANWGNLFKEGNSYFIPDKIEADAHLYTYSAPFNRNLSKEAQSKLFDEMYYGNRLMTTRGVESGLDPEQRMRTLLNARQVGQTVGTSIGNPYYDARGVLTGMDIGRGGLTYEQGEAIARALEFKGYRDNQLQGMNAAEQSYNNTISELMARAAAETDPAMKAQYEKDAQGTAANLAKMREGLQSYQNAFDSYMAKVNTIDPNLTDLSSIELIRALRGGGG